MIYYFVAFMFLMTILINITLALTPRMSRRSNLFGLNIPSDLQERPEIKQLKYFFTKTMLLLNIPISFPFIWILTMDNVTKMMDFLSLYGLVSIIINFLVFCILYFETRKRLSNYLEKTPSKIQKTNKKTTIDLNFRETPFVLSTWVFIILNGCFILFSIIYTLVIYPKIPQEIPTNFDAMMKPTAYSQKSFSSVFLAPMIQIFIFIVFIITNRGLYKAKQENVLKYTKQYNYNDRKFRKASSISILLSSIFIQILMTFIQYMTMTPGSNYLLLMPVALLSLVGTVGISWFIGFKYRQSGEGLTPDLNFDTQNDDDAWKLGLFYYNPKNPSLWVMKKTGMGLTTNFARWESWLLIVILLVVPILMTFIASYY